MQLSNINTTLLNNNNITLNFMAVPKKRLSKSKTIIRKKLWKKKAKKKVIIALNWAKLILKN